MPLLDMDLNEITAFITGLGELAYRGKQLFQGLQQGQTLEEITTLPRNIREKIAQIQSLGGVTIRERFLSGDGETKKYLFLLGDCHIIEGVLMRYRHGYSLCVSSQVGCRMGCAFCASTLGGLERLLTPGEMLGQVLAVNGDLPNGASVGHVVIMGSGEPLDNYDHVVKFLRLLNHSEGLNMSCRHISLSTCGLVPEMLRFADEGLPVTLSLSLHAPQDELRQRLMPIARRYGLDDIMEACRVYVKKTGRRVIFEYALIDSVNDSETQALQLAQLTRGLQCHVNLIPLNDVSEHHQLRKSPPHRVAAFMKTLESAHVSVTLRREMGSDIAGACGQLRRSVFENE